MALRGSTRRNRRLLPVAVTAAAAFAFVFAAHSWYAVSLRPLRPDSATGEPATGKLYHLAPKTTTREVARQLAEEGYIRSASAFTLYCITTHKSTRLQAGYYCFTPAMCVQEIATALAEGKVSAVKVTVPEGYTVRQVARRLEGERFCKADDFIAAARPYAVRGKVNLPTPPVDTLEGYLYPGTYIFNKGLPLEDAVTQMVQGFEDNFLARNREAVRRSPLTLHQLVTLASLVEREARLDDERPIIAGVLMNRLRQNMRLQCDATVQYALPEHKARLTLDDLRVQSPYNTYRNNGLPPGPIANPGLPSLMAALHPANIPYLFYVAAGDGSGRHIFTKTFGEHKKAKSTARNGAVDSR